MFSASIMDAWSKGGSQYNFATYAEGVKRSAYTLDLLQPLQLQVSRRPISPSQLNPFTNESADHGNIYPRRISQVQR